MINSSASDWYHDDISRKEAEEKLYYSGKDGAFLVRKSDTVPGAYVLSLQMNRFIHHYRIRLDRDGFFVAVNSQSSNISSMKFESLSAVIKYLMQNTGQIQIAGPLLYPIAPEIIDMHDDYTELSDDEEEEDDDDEEQDETIRRCPVDLRLSLKKRPSTTHSHGNDTMKLFQGVFNNLDTLELEDADPEFIPLIKRYVETSAFWDIQNDDHGGTGCLERLVDYSCRKLLQELRVYNQKMEFLDKLISGIARGSQLENNLCEELPPVSEEHLDKLAPALRQCSMVSNNIQGKITNVFKHLSRSIRVSEECMINSTKTFDAREGLRKCQIVVDPRRGTVALGKQGVEYFHQQIKRLEKNYKDPHKMTIIFMDKKKRDRDILFDDVRTREEFFHTISQIKHIHKSETDVKNVSVFCCTWNMGEVEPTTDVNRLFDNYGDYIKGYYNPLPDSTASTTYDIYAIGSQEANITDKDWVNMIKRGLEERHPGIPYSVIGSQTLQGIRLLVLVKSEHINKISCQEFSYVKTGVGGIVGNKGAVGVSFTFGATNMAFISCHLAARAERKLKRSQMYHDICRQLNLGKKSKFASFELSYRFDHVFWVGDLNYRLETKYAEVLERIRIADYAGLLKHDQLRHQQQNGNIFHGYTEGEILFPPTYRYKRGARDDYVYIKYKPTGNVHNVPSYCDRILSHSLPLLKQTQTGYYSNLYYKASDHAPVIATYHVATRVQYVAAKHSENPESEAADDSLKIRFPIIQAKIKTNNPMQFCLKFSSYLLEGAPTSKPAPRVLADYNEELNCFPVQPGLTKTDVSYWSTGDLPDLEPILPNKDYIANDYIFIQIVNNGGDECYGQGILPMQDKVKSDSLQSFCITLSLNDEICGELRGRVCLSRNPITESRSLFSDQLTNPEWSSSPAHSAVSPSRSSPHGAVSPSRSSPHGAVSPSRLSLMSPGGRSSGSSSSTRSQNLSSEFPDPQQQDQQPAGTVNNLRYYYQN